MSSLKLNGSTSGYVEIVPPAVAGNNSVTLPSGSGTLVTGDSGGNLNVSGIVTATSFVIGAGSTSSPSLSPTGDSNTGIFFPAADTIAFGEGGSEVMRINSSGRLLVGTNSAVSGSDSTNGNLQVIGGGGGVYGGYLVIGRSVPATSSSTNQLLGRIAFTDSTAGEYAYITANIDATPGSGDYPGRLVFSTTADGASSPTERMRISNDGTILVNRTSNTGTASQIALTYPGGSRWGMTFNDGDSVAANPVRFERGGTLVGSIATNSGSTAYNTSSDYRLKENIVPLTGAIDRLNQLQVHRFNFIADPVKTVDGFIAHEAQAVVPECVTGEKDAVNEDGSISPQGIDQSKLVPLLTAALQEAIGRIKTLEAEVAALKGA